MVQLLAPAFAGVAAFLSSLLPSQLFSGLCKLLSTLRRKCVGSRRVEPPREADPFAGLRRPPCAFMRAYCCARHQVDVVLRVPGLGGVLCPPAVVFVQSGSAGAPIATARRFRDRARRGLSDLCRPASAGSRNCFFDRSMASGAQNPNRSARKKAHPKSPARGEKATLAPETHKIRPINSIPPACLTGT